VGHGIAPPTNLPQILADYAQIKSSEPRINAKYANLRAKALICSLFCSSPVVPRSPRRATSWHSISN